MGPLQVKNMIAAMFDFIKEACMISNFPMEICHYFFLKEEMVYRVGFSW